MNNYNNMTNTLINTLNETCKCCVEKEVMYNGELIIDIVGEDCNGEKCCFVDIGKDCEELINGLKGNDENYVGLCSRCGEYDIKKYSCDCCDFGVCYDCYDMEIEKSCGMLYDVDSKWVCGCEIGECYSCNEFRMNEDLDFCNDCDKVYCNDKGCSEIDNYGNMCLCGDCITECEVESGCCNGCDRECEEVLEEGDIMYDLNGEYVCNGCM